ncbi:MAG: hypothetical protein HY551_04465, partial [Elusimicrobia bacterium]|nr:hypothetical protein [Elusimicrobiota bacterium]
MEKEYLDPSSVNDVDTARLALRWALDRIRILQDEANRARQESKSSAERMQGLAKEIAQKDEALHRWQSTMKLWEENWKDQRTLEAEIKERLEKELVAQEDARGKEERRQLEREISLLQRQLADKETAIGNLRRQQIEAVQQAKADKEKDIQGLLEHQETALAEAKASLLERLKIQEETLAAREKELHEEERLLAQKIKIRDLELERQRRQFEEDLRTEHREALAREDQKYQDLLRERSNQMEAALRQREAEFQDIRRRLEADHQKRLEEAEALIQHRTAQK